MKAEDFNLSKFNNTLAAGTKEQDLDYCSAITMEPRKISVTLEYDPGICCAEYAVLGPDLQPGFSTDFSSYYYGCSPKIDNQLIVEAISTLAFRTPETFEDFLSRHCHLFMLHKDQSDYLPHVAKLILLTVAVKYGICLKLDESTKFLEAQAARFPAVLTVVADKGFIKINGCPTQELLDLLQPYRFKKESDLWTINPTGHALETIYRDKRNIRLLSGKVFYSGVLIKPLRFRNPNTYFESDGIKNIVITYERTTFAAVRAFDENNLAHPLLAESREKLRKMFRDDDASKRSLLKFLDASREDDEAHYKALSDYLKESFNVNQIGVSSNIKTSDKKIFLGLRDAGNIDGGDLYPSVNGNAEVYDADVSFYNHSVYEDLPTISVLDTRSDLLGEISREAYGELRLITRNESWESYGIVLSGTKPPEKPETYDPGPRRFHFNVLFENEVPETLSQIKEKKIRASESFENQDFIGVNVHYYKNPFRKFLAGVMKCIRYILNSKNVVESILLLFVTATSIHSFVLSADFVSSFFSGLFAGVAAIANLIQLYEFLRDIYRNRKTTRHICVYQSMDYEDIDLQIRKAMGKHYHPVAYASLKMHVENAIRSKLPKAEKQEEKKEEKKEATIAD